ncbi:MAG: hypothetical protein BWZ06_01948 [Bacteroidetes bacterium ADurb.BinA261]|nr:MAG: hypothetical protein BWZ06_01948 [Bacteroidetes bacterium ADurb.BinA261]
MFFAVVFPGIFADDGLLANRTDLCEFGIFFYFDSPALIVGQVPVKPVDVMQGKDIDIGFNEIHRHEMACHIKHHSPISEAGLVVDGHCRVQNGNIFADRSGFAKRLNAIENAGFTCPFDGNCLVVDSNLIGFGILVFKPKRQNDSTFCSVARNFGFNPNGCLEVF